MGRKVGMIHAGSSNVPLFNELTSEIMPDVEVVHLVDEGLLSMAEEQFRRHVLRRLKTLASFAEESGAEIVLFTCTAFGRLAEEIENAVNIPVMAVLEIMTDEAMGASDHIGILGSHPGALASTSQIIQEQAKLGGKKTEVKTLLCPGAFDALRRGDLATHDRIVIEHLNQLMEEVKVIVVPQPSIEKAVEKVPQARRKVPIMSSAHLSVERLKERLDSIA